MIVGVEFEHMFMVVARPHGVAQGRKPRPFHQARIDGELGACDTSAVKSVNVFGVGLEFLFFQILGPTRLSSLIRSLIFGSVGRGVGR